MAVTRIESDNRIILSQEAFFACVRERDLRDDGSGRVVGRDAVMVVESETDSMGREWMQISVFSVVQGQLVRSSFH